MTGKFKQILTLALSAGLIYGLLIWALLRPSDALSTSERRPLAQRPELSWSTLQSGTFMESFEDFTLDQFPLREQWRTAHSLAQLHLFWQSDVHGLYFADNQVAKLEYPLDNASVSYALSRFQFIYDRYLSGHCTNIYTAVVPDKSYYLAAQNGYPTMDYDALFAQVQNTLSFAEYISLTDTLDADSYYTTDAHWRQEALSAAADRLAETMEVTLTDTAYTSQTLPQPFYGVYYGQSALPLAPDAVTILESDTLSACTVYDYETDTTLPVYDLARAEGNDAYEVFLSGSKSLLRLENPNAQTERTLIVFRDSFGSALIPLLASGYRTITLVDIRYLPPERLGNFLEFDGQDVLFLYSSSVLNHSETIK